MKVKYLTYSETSNLIEFQHLIKLAKEYFKLKGENRVLEPNRIRFEIEKNDKYVYVGPASIESIDGIKIIGIKNINYFKNNFIQYGKSNIFGTVSLLDSADGKLLSVLDDRFITYARTVASLGVFLKHLSHKLPSDVKIGIYGAGQMLRYTLEVLQSIFMNPSFYLYSPEIQNRKSWLKNIERALKINLSIETPSKIEKYSDIIITQTNETQKHVINTLNENNKVICGIGSIFPHYIGELSKKIFKGANKVICDDKDKVLEEHGALKNFQDSLDLQNLSSFITISNSDFPLIYQSVGLMSLDVFFAYNIYLKALKEKKGTNLKCIDNLYIRKSNND